MDKQKFVYVDANYLKELEETAKKVDYYKGIIDGINMVADRKTEPKRGEWVDMGDFEQCSVCKGTRLKEFQSYYGKTTWIKTPYCPNCGAKMNDDRKDENSSEKPNNSTISKMEQVDKDINVRSKDEQTERSRQ